MAKPVDRMRAVHPGEVLREDYLAPPGLSVNALALALGVPATRIHEIVKERRGVTADTAMRLARYFGGDGASWLALQAAHDLKTLPTRKQIERQVASRDRVAVSPPAPISASPAMNPASPQSVVQAQLDAYNAKDIEARLGTYAADAEQFTLHGERLAKGRDEMRARVVSRFAEPHLHARLLNRTVIGNAVVDLERITRDFPEGPATIERLCIDEVSDGLIQRASFAVGDKALHATPGDAV